MNEFHLPHVEDLTTNAKLPGQLTENFKAIENNFAKIESALNDIKELGTRLTTAENNIIDLQTRTSSLERQIKKLNGIIFGMEYINDTDEIPLDSSTPNPSEVEINDDVTVDDDKAEVAADLPHDVIDNEVS
ncbi:hypothetical protein [Limosilactobacillus galli]|uniref:hypothetical protein n=1 Tax=Limosilactobacillus galli TaxID=2991834 RepID=UPI0024B97240|nr:hypothetical protein [Limosilactobacillus galli]